ncbi:hypothetical protein CC80DRAFT_594199 [Byssothecium circinans]|uniref:Protein kinase domain-containing protein n=1 Tax=Byssothecium circinans TaxID=147558 RepID=A0A6A5U2Q4_9PLEO|nr:hypothetical protein CC80DRAFT_594199 [Byssothecium circinans]
MTGDQGSPRNYGGTPRTSQTTPSNAALLVHSIGDLHTLCDVYDIDENGDGSYVFQRSTFSFIDSDDNVYYGQAPIKRTSLSIEDANKYLERIPDEVIYPESSSRVTAVFDPATIDGYIKRPKLTNFRVEDAPLFHQLLLEEADVFEHLRQHPHSNLVGYHGCFVKRGRGGGGVITHIDKKSWMDGIESAVKHLHGLGLAHNDLNPANIMLDEHKKEAIVIDLGSCKAFGEQLLSAGTEGWVDEFFSTSERRHDEAALKKIWAWLESDGRSRGDIADRRGDEDLATNAGI